MKNILELLMEAMQTEIPKENPEAKMSLSYTKEGYEVEITNMNGGQALSHMSRLVVSVCDDLDFPIEMFAEGLIELAPILELEIQMGKKTKHECSRCGKCGKKEANT